MKGIKTKSNPINRILITLSATSLFACQSSPQLSTSCPNLTERSNSVSQIQYSIPGAMYQGQGYGSNNDESDEKAKTAANNALKNMKSQHFGHYMDCQSQGTAINTSLPPTIEEKYKPNHINGIQIWVNNAPSKNYKVIRKISNGIIQEPDNNSQSTQLKRLSDNDFENQVMKEAKEAQADGIIFTDSLGGYHISSYIGARSHVTAELFIYEK